MKVSAAKPIPFTEWAPDRAVISSGQVEVKGVISQGGRYVPLASPQDVGTALINDRCIGGWGGYDSAGNIYTFLGDAGKLYRVAGGTASVINSGLTASQDWAWSFSQFGNSVLAAARGAGGVYRFQLGSDSAFSLIGSSPDADVLFRVRNHVFACSRNVVNVSAFDDPTDYLPDTATQAFQTTIAADLGNVMAGISGEQGAMFLERGIIRVTYTGAAVPFVFDEVEGGRGAIGPHAVSYFGRGTYYAAEDGFYLFDGMQSQSIGSQRVDSYFAANLNYPYRYRTVAAYDAVRKAWMVIYPKGSSTVPSEALIYSVADNRWTRDEITAQHLFTMPRQGVNIDDNAQVLAAFGTTNLDEITESFDSPAWRESRAQWAMVSPERRLQLFTGGSREAVLDTSVFEPVPGRTAFVSEVWPMTDSAPADTSVAVYMHRNGLYQTATVASTGQMQTEGYCPVAAEARYLRARLTIAEGAVWTEASGLLTDGAPAGGR